MSDRRIVTGVEESIFAEGPGELLLRLTTTGGALDLTMSSDIATMIFAHIEARIRQSEAAGRPPPRIALPERVARFGVEPTKDAPEEVHLLLTGDRATHTVWRLQKAVARQLAALLTAAAEQDGPGRRMT
jgi:hypothetical protein